MRILAVLWTVSLAGLCRCGELGNLRKETGDVVFDLSSPDPSLARDYESTVDGVTYYSYFPKGQFFSKVVDGGVTLWEAEGEERCDVLFSNVGDRTRVILHVWVKGLPSKMLYYEKLDGEWKLVTIRVKGVPESEEPVSPKEHAAELDFASLGCPLGGFSGSEAKPKVTLPPTESNNNGEDASENKVEGGAPDDEEESGESQPKEVDKEEPDQQSNEYAAGPVADPQESGDIPPESPANDSSCQPQTEDTEQTAVSSSDPVDQQPIEVSELQESEPLQSTESSQEVAYPSTQQVEGFEVPEDSKDDNPEVTPQDHSEEAPVDPGACDKAEETTPAENSATLTVAPILTEPEKPASSLASKVDFTLFNVLCSVEDHVKVLKLTAKENQNPKKLKFDRELVWEDKKKSCLSAVLYLDGEKPTLAVIKAVKGGKESTVYRYHNGKKWKKGREGTHKTRLKELQDAARPKQPPKVSKPLDPPGPLVLDLSVESANDDKVTLYKNDNGELKYRAFTPDNGNYFEKILHYGVVIWEAESGQRGTFASFHSKEDAMLIRMYVQTGGHVERKYFEKNASGGWTSMTEEVYDQKLQDLKSGATNQSSLQGSATLRTDNPTVVPSSDEFSEAQMVKQGGTTPITLDLANPDKSKFVIRDGKLGTLYLHKSGKEINELVYGRRRIWKAKDGQGCKWVEVAIDSKGNGLAYPYLKSQKYVTRTFQAVVKKTEDNSTSNPSGDSPAPKESANPSTTPSQ
ncbi:signal peptide containing protein [Theileria equi strain WA]|uniref:Signal peptide containing protein n=1 Tax=Theileria equi strain WA TaxID=1537102 RepID=L1LA96_THEEQ|nr:signal peptide containing protein [Theileria equi strain WA]EKX72377.1 signal peptide containing protein [Theileria equi strain WA]|eukprot:XP_004831829.1 signal peptide containing protein [Theileria equi strain WA]